MRRINTKLPPESTQRGIFFGSSLRQNGSQPHSTRREVFYTLTHHFTLFEFFSLRTILLRKETPLLNLYAISRSRPPRVFRSRTIRNCPSSFYTLSRTFALFEFFSLRTIQLLKKTPLLDLYASPHFRPLRIFLLAYN